MDKQTNKHVNSLLQQIKKKIEIKTLIQECYGNVPFAGYLLLYLFSVTTLKTAYSLYLFHKHKICISHLLESFISHIRGNQRSLEYETVSPDHVIREIQVSEARHRSEYTCSIVTTLQFKVPFVFCSGVVCC